MVSTQSTLNEKKSYMICIKLPLAMNRCQRILGKNKLITQKGTLTRVDYKTRH
jgi:hypothetical protein